VTGIFGSKKPDFEEKKHDPQSRLEKGIHDFQPRNLGYFADHYHVRLKPHWADPNNYYHWETDIVEIQVLSAFGHACYEAEHDIGYKTIDGATTEHESRILDSLHGLVNTADVLLEQLHQLYLERTREQFGASHKLSKFLCDEIKSKGILLAKEKKEKKFEEEAKDLKSRSERMVKDIQQQGNFDLLYQFLKSQQCDTPSFVRKTLGQLAIPEEDCQPEKTLSHYGLKHVGADVRTTICFIHHITSQKERTQSSREGLSGDEYRDTETFNREVDEGEHGEGQDAVSVSIEHARILTAASLCLLKFCHDSPEEVIDWINEHINAEDGKREALHFLFVDDQMAFILRGKPEDYWYVEVEKNAQLIGTAWSWFEAQQQAANICGLAFRAAKMGLLVDKVQDSSYDASRLKAISLASKEGQDHLESSSGESSDLSECRSLRHENQDP
jgi:hypothetical protein